MTYKLTLVEYNENIFVGDDMIPDISYRDYIPGVIGSDKITNKEHQDTYQAEIQKRIEDIRDGAFAISSSAAGESLFEHYSDELTITEYCIPTWRGVFYGDFVYQTFTPQTSHLLTKVRLYLRKIDVANDNDAFWNCLIRATIDGVPSGSVLINKIIYSPDPTPFDWQWVEFVFDDQIQLDSGTMYAIGFYMSPGGSEDPIHWARRGSDVYPRGQIWHWIWRSYTGPETPIYPGDWEDGSDEGDLFFEEWGYEI